jgi:hypothetical protein
VAQFGVELREDLRLVEFQQAGVAAHETPDVNLRGEDVVVALVERLDVVGTDLREVGDLMDRQPLGEARLTKLFRNC